MAIHGAIQSLLWRSDLSQVHVVSSVTEHNSVLRTLEDLHQRRGLAYSLVGCDARGWVDPLDIRKALRPNTALVVINHASNVTGVVQDIAGISEELSVQSRVFGKQSDGGIALMVDGAQSLGYIDFDMRNWGVDVVVSPGHKGLCGPFGVGMIVARAPMIQRMRSPWIGGTGRSSDSLEGPFGWRESIESGNINAPAIMAMGKGIEYVLSDSCRGVKTVFGDWLRRLLEAIEGQSSLHMVGYTKSFADKVADRVPIVSFVSDQFGTHEMAMMLDSVFGIECRSGLHCAGKIHEHIGSSVESGALRMSFGHTSGASDVEAAVAGIQALGACI
jgi:selenocysteine lyase/cysteine desulfurase